MFVSAEPATQREVSGLALDLPQRDFKCHRDPQTPFSGGRDFHTWHNKRDPSDRLGKEERDPVDVRNQQVYSPWEYRGGRVACKVPSWHSGSSAARRCLVYKWEERANTAPLVAGVYNMASNKARPRVLGSRRRSCGCFPPHSSHSRCLLSPSHRYPWSLYLLLSFRSL